MNAKTEEGNVGNIISNSGQYIDSVGSATDAATAYYNSGTELMTDAEYDTLLVAISAYESANPDDTIQHELFTAVAAGTSGAGDVEHTTPMLSLDKATTLTDVKKFVAAVISAGGTVSLEPKLDGIAVNLTYVDGTLTVVATRGDGHTGEDITARILALDVAGMPHTVEWPGTVNIRGELVMTKSDFEFSNGNRVATGKTQFANPRNATAGTVRKSDPSYKSKLTFVTYDGEFSNQRLTSLGFIASGTIFADNGAEDIIDGIHLFGDIRKQADFEYPTDGIVIKANEQAARDKLGAGSRAPKWAIAYKYEAETATTRVLDIEVAVGRTGAISYTAVLEPVLIDGSTVSRATLHNPKFIAENDIRIGSAVLCLKANDIIPRVQEVISQPEGSTPYIPSIYCPVSGTELDRSGEIWRSTDPAASIGALIAYAASRDALDIDGLGVEVADALVDSRLVNDLGDLFLLTVEQLSALQLAPTAKSSARSFGSKNAVKLIAGIEAAKAQPLNRVITALGIRKSGRTFGRRLASGFSTMDVLLETTESGFLNSGVEGIGPERARLFYEGFQKLRPVIEKMRDAGVNMGAIAEAAGTDASAAPLAGVKVVVTGAMTGPLAGLSRNEVNELIESLGGKSSGSVSSSTSLLVCGEEGSSKFVKAQELSIRIVTPEEFAGMVGR